MREIVQRADSRVPLSEGKSQGAWIDQFISREIVFASRAPEIGIRMALGAPRRRVVWMVLRKVCLLAAVGLAISIPTALMASKVVESFLFGMKPTDPLAIAGSVAVLLVATILAGFLPARNASRIDPMIAIRHE